MDVTFDQSSTSLVTNPPRTPPSANFTSTTISITNFSIVEGELQVWLSVAQDCYDDKGVLTDNKPSTLELPFPHTISDRNEFYAVGCNSIATYQGTRILGLVEEETSGNIVTVCENSLGKELPSVCSLFGCARSSVPDGLHNISVTLAALGSQRRGNDSWNIKYPCSYAFIVEQANFTFAEARSFQQLQTSRQRLPVIVNWLIDTRATENGSDTCDIAQTRQDYPCKANSRCVTQHRQFLHYRPVNWPVGYLCQCLPGYEGNPYIGCQDIDECSLESMPRSCVNGACVNLPGNYSCVCRKGYTSYSTRGRRFCVEADHRTNQTLLLVIYIVGTGIPGILFLVIGTWWFYKAIKRRQSNKRKKKFYRQNGGLLLEQQLSSGEVNVEKTKLFSSNELEKATDYFNVNRILGEGGQGTVYKGMLTDGRIVAVKKSKIVTGSEIGDFINEIVILSQINHRHVVQLLGCCLETEIPLQVPTKWYTFSLHSSPRSGVSSNMGNTLAHFNRSCRSLSYLHSSATCPIYHRDIKAANILLDDKDRAKVADFGTSRSVSVDHTHLTTLVHGTFGYLDPEYFHSSQFTDKSDVYSFGVVLAELLTGQKPVCVTRSQENRSLATYFLLSMEQDLLFHILDDQVINDGGKEVITAVANLARRCLNMKGKKRPTMKEVAVELERIRLSAKGLDHAQQNLADNGDVQYQEIATEAHWDVVSTSTGLFTESGTGSSWDVQPLLLNTL